MRDDYRESENWLGKHRITLCNSFYLMLRNIKSWQIGGISVIFHSTQVRKYIGTVKCSGVPFSRANTQTHTKRP